MKLIQIVCVALILVENAMATTMQKRLDQKVDDSELRHRAGKVLLFPLSQGSMIPARRSFLVSLFLVLLAPPACILELISGRGGYYSSASPNLLLGMHSAR
jgi:hypothetical protein